MRTIIYSGYFGACTTPNNPDDLKWAAVPKVVLGGTDIERIKRDLERKSLDSFPEMENHFSDAIAFDDEFIKITLKKGRSLIAGCYGAFSYESEGVSIGIRAFSVCLLIQKMKSWNV